MRHAHCGLICGSAAGTARARLRSTIIRCRIDDCAASRTADRTGSVDFAMLGNGLEVPPRVPDPTWRWPWPSVRPNGHRGHPRKRPNGPFRPDGPVGDSLLMRGCRTARDFKRAVCVARYGRSGIHRAQSRERGVYAHGQRPRYAYGHT
jgi:hypothetical protein